MTAAFLSRDLVEIRRCLFGDAPALRVSHWQKLRKLETWTHIRFYPVSVAPTAALGHQGMSELEGLREQPESNCADEAIQILLLFPLNSQSTTITIHRIPSSRLIRNINLFDLTARSNSSNFQDHHQANMTNEITAIVLIDPYNDFLHQDGKLNFMVRDSLDKTNTIPNLRKLLDVAREKKFPVFYCLHQQSHDHSMQGWTMMNAALTGLKGAKVFEEGSWGAEFYEGLAPIAANGEVIVSKHWNSR